MTDREQREVFAKNLVDVLSEKNETQKDLADAIGETPQTVNTWCKAIALPRMGKVQRLAAHLEVPVTRLLDRDENSRLSSDELNLIRDYRMLDPSDREVVRTLVESLKKKTSRMEDSVNVG